MSNVNAAVLLGFVLTGVPAWVTAAEAASRSWHFAVLLDGKQIGAHDFAIVRQGDDLPVDSVARFKASLPVCVRTFAYWNEHLNTDPRLLNAQTGEYQPVTLTRAGTQHFTLRGQKLAGGRTLRYELH
jgi:hypothetical protein